MRRWVAVIAALFAFRLWFALSREFFFEDETQIFLLGLRYYATGDWPFFGPDVVWTRSEIPGALQALLVGIPLRIAPYPESSYVLLVALSFATLTAFTWYASLHRPVVPRWLLWGWFFTMPWTLQFSGHLINTSYILPAALVFFVGFFEALPSTSLDRVRPPAAFALMGAALTWLMQIHMSWPLLLPFAAAAWLGRWRHGVRAAVVNVAAFSAGAAGPACLLLPTLLAHGAGNGSGGVLRNLHLHPVNPWIIVTTAARFLSFASLEIVRFIAIDAPKRLEFLARHRWLAPLALVVGAAGVIQPVWMLVDGLRSGRRWRDPSARRRWDAMRMIAAACVLLVYASYWLVVEPPQAHAFYVLSPVAFLFAAYWWSFVDSPRARRVAAGVLITSVAYHAGLAWAQMPEISLYKNRSVVAAAVRLREPEMFGHRRDFAIAGGPASLSDPSRPYDPGHDIEVVSSILTPGVAGSLHWSVRLRNTNRRVAFRDLHYLTTYRDANGVVVDQRREIIKDIFQPGAAPALEVNDGYAPASFATADFHIVAAEALLPAPATIPDANARE